MNEQTKNQERFAELIWRTVKLRVSLLVAASVLLLVTWAGLTNGNQEGRKLDLEFCNQMENEIAKQLPANWPKNDMKVCTPELSRYYIEHLRTIDSALPLEGGIFETRRAERAEYDQKRRAAYKLEIGLSSQGAESKVIVNALSVAEVVPFVVILILAIVILLGFQQNAYRAHLRKMLCELKSKEELKEGIASNQFLSGFESEGIGRLGRWILLSPEATSIWAAFGAVVYLFFAVLAAFVINLINLTNSIVVNYVTGLYSVVFALTFALLRTHRNYKDNAERSGRVAVYRKKLGWLRSSWFVCCLIGLALLSVFLPWADSVFSKTLRGYNFVFNQKPVFQGSALTEYPIEPNLFVEIRFQLLVVALFFVSCAAISFLILSKPRSVWMRGLKRANWLLGIATLFFSLNYLIYMCALEYGALTNTDFNDSPFAIKSGHVGGYALSWYDPAYGFVVFVMCCVLLAWISLWRTSDTI